MPKALSAVEWAAFAFLIDAFEGVGGALVGGRAAVDPAATVADLFVAGIEDDVGEGTEGA